MLSTARITRFAFQNFWRNFWLSLITVSMLVLTLFTVNILLVLNLVTDRAVTFVENRVDVSVYFEQEVTSERAAGVAGFLRGLNQVRDVEVITADEALERFRDRHEGDEEILASLDEVSRNPFGPSLIVHARSVDDFPFILETLDNPQYQDDIREKDFSNYEGIIERIQDWTNRIQYFGYALAIIFLIIAMLIVFNTVRMGIYIHREEVGIMKLVGASNWFIRAPFLLEVIIYSFLATLIVIGLVLPAVAIIDPQFSSYFNGAPIGLVDYFMENGWMIFGLQFIGLALISMLATGMAMRKYLRV